MGSKTHRNKNCTTNCYINGMRNFTTLERFSRYHQTWIERYLPKGTHHYSTRLGSISRSSSSIRNRILRRRIKTSLVRNQNSQRKATGSILKSNWIHRPTDGCRIRQLLHKRSDENAYPRIFKPRRGNEENRTQSCEAMRRNRGSRTKLYPKGDFTGIFQAILDQKNGARPQKLPPTCRNHSGARQ